MGWELVCTPCSHQMGSKCILRSTIDVSFVVAMLLMVSTVPSSSHLAIACAENLCIWEADSGNLLYKFTLPDGMSVQI